jgi:hypothetical protein
VDRSAARAKNRTIGNPFDLSVEQGPQVRTLKETFLPLFLETEVYKKNKIIPLYCSMLHTVCWLICEACIFVLNAVCAMCKNVSCNVDFKLNPRCCGKKCDKWAKNMLYFLSAKKGIRELRNQVFLLGCYFFFLKDRCLQNISSKTVCLVKCNTVWELGNCSGTQFIFAEDFYGKRDSYVFIPL